MRKWKREAFGAVVFLGQASDSFGGGDNLARSGELFIKILSRDVYIYQFIRYLLCEKQQNEQPTKKQPTTT
jgi:hypothetical protein